MTSPPIIPTVTPSPADEQFTTKLSCGRPVTATHALALYALAITPPMLEILDVSNPLKPALLCLLAPAQGGRFVQAANQVVFWIGDQLGAVDLSSGKLVQTARLPAPAFEGAFSSDGRTFAYRAAEDTAGTTSTHLNSDGYDRTLYTQAPMGGHGGLAPGQGPADQLEFSADGTELLDYNAFRGPSVPYSVLVYRTRGILGTYAPPDSFRLLQSNTAIHGVWAPTGSTLYFYVSNQGLTGEVDSLDSAGQQSSLARNVTGFSWPRVGPAADRIVYDAYASTPDNCGGLPHVWALSLAARTTSQLSPAVSSMPVFISQSLIWSDEEQPAQCGPGGETSFDGVIVAYSLTSGAVTTVDMTGTVPGIGGPALPPPNTGSVLDVWF